MGSKELTKTQHDIIKKLVVYVVLVVIASLFVFYLSGSVEESDKKYKWLQNDISELSRKLDGFNKKTLEFSEAVKTWDGLSDSSKKLEGLRINDAKDMLDKLQVQYKLSAFKTSFSKPEEIAGDYKTDTVSLVSSVISISFNAISDEYIYNFIEDITKNFPGYVQIKSFTMSKPAPVTKEILKKISLGEDVSIISVTLDFFWHDLKYKAPTEPPQPNGGTQPK